LRGNTDIVDEDYDRTETCELCPLSSLHAVGSYGYWIPRNVMGSWVLYTGFRV